MLSENIKQYRKAKGMSQEELARLNEELARSVEVERIAARGNEKRNLILFCSFGALAAALFADNEMVSAVLAGAWMLAAAGILYRNLALLSGEAAVHPAYGTAPSVDRAG